jgi:hypothetical protein
MLSQQTQQLISKYQNSEKLSEIAENILTIHVDEVASKVAAFYERMKGIVDWKEEHLLRKRAIERTLKRRIIFQKENKEMAKSLISELIRAGHFPNDKIPEHKIEEVQKIINKYFFIFENSPQKLQKEKIELQNWLIDILSYEIEKTLSPPMREEALIEYMASSMTEKIKIQGERYKVNENEKSAQIYIAVQKALFKFDESTITYYILSKKYPEWKNLSETSPLLLEIAQSIYLIKQDIGEALNHPLSIKFLKICERYNAPYLILGDIISENPEDSFENLENTEILENKVKESYNKRLKKLKIRLKRAAIYSTISIFITKVAIAIAVEIPIDKLIGDFTSLSLMINILFPPFLMFLLVATIRPPSEENFDRVMMEVTKIVYQRDKQDIYTLKIPEKRGKILNFVIFFIFGLAFLISFGVIIKILQRLDFGALSMVIFVFFVSTISFLGAKIRERSKELTIKEKKDTFLNSLFDFFTLPVIRTGSWFSEKLSRLNIALIISALIDMPLLTFVQFLEQWRYFLKEKKEEIR